MPFPKNQEANPPRTAKLSHTKLQSLRRFVITRLACSGKICTIFRFRPLGGQKCRNWAAAVDFGFWILDLRLVGQARAVDRLLFEGFEDDGCSTFVRVDDDRAEEGFSDFGIRDF